jgi:mannose-6-phosphate isomerase-like protein (cupin superfamily)
MNENEHGAPVNSGRAPRPAPLFWSSAGEGEATWFGPNRMTIKATAAQTGGAYGLVESWIPSGSAPPLHVHHREDEAFWIMEGKLRFVCGAQEIHAGPGSFVFLPRGVPHGFVVEGDAPAHILTLMTPGGGEGYFIDAGRPPEGPGLPPAGPLDIEKNKRVAPLYGAEIVGPPLR